MRPVSQKIRVLAMLALGFTPAALHGAPVWPLLSEARIAGAEIYLSDLLPPQTSPEFRSIAAKIRLGSAPAAGSSVILSAEKIEEMIPRSTRMELLVPSEIVVRRTARLVTREEVLAALKNALQSTSFPGNPRIDPEDVHFSAQVRVVSDNAGLRVRRVDFDPALQQARFLMVSADDPRALPFLVTARLKSDGSATAGDMAGVTPVSLTGGRTENSHAGDPAAGSDVLITLGKPAHLHVVSGSMQMFLDVVALESGGLHQIVRVRVPGSSHVLRGQVVAPGRLEARF